MLGEILAKLTDPSQAEAALAALSDETFLTQVQVRAEAENITIGAFAARAVRRVLDGASEEIWLDILGKMGRTSEPGAAALAVILDQALLARICKGDVKEAV